MANATAPGAICTSFKQDLLNGIHAFGTSVVRAGTGADTFNGSLYLTTGSIGATTTAYTATGEVSGTGYTAGGTGFVNGVAPTTSGTTAYWTPASISWASVVLTTAFDTVLMYNNTASGKNAVACFNFGSTTISSGSFSITMPANAVGTALLRIA